MRLTLLALVLFLSFIFHPSSFAVAASGSAGTTGFELFRTDGYARSSALGESQVSVSGSLNSIFTNPAGLADIHNRVGSATYFRHVLDMNSGNLAYAQSVAQAGTFGIGITYFDYGDFDRADENGQQLGNFRASDIQVTASGARELKPGVLGGASVKFLTSSIDNTSASAVAADFGAIYHTNYEGWDVGGGVFNLGFATSAYLREKDSLPITYKLGLSVPLKHLPARFSFGGEYTNAEGIRGAGGLELAFTKFLQGRLGYNTIGIDQRVGTSRDALAGFSAGLGVSVKHITVDYSLNSYGEIGFLNRFTLTSTFGGGRQPAR